MRSVDDHLREILGVVTTLAPIEMALLEAHGCALAEDIVADAPLPGFDNSAMDGYAVQAADVAAASEFEPVVLHVVGDIPAGSAATLSVQSGLCVRIMTGAPVPRGADAVVPVELTDGGVAQVRVTKAVAPGAHIRRAGEDVTAGTVVLRRGTVLGAPHLGLLAAIGRRNVRVTPRPRVVVLSTGTELVEPGEPLREGQIHDANGYALAAAAREAGAIAFRTGIVPDDPRRLLDTIEDHLIRADAVLTTGGVSVGAYDFMKDVLSRLGRVSFERVAMQPGMPQAFGLIGPDDTPVFGLPGNPVSALVSFEVFVRPSLRRMIGAEALGRPQVPAVLTSGVRSPAGKRQYLRVHVEHTSAGWQATPSGGTGSHLIAGLAAANGLAVVPEDVTEVLPGTQVTTWLLERRGL